MNSSVDIRFAGADDVDVIMALVLKSFGPELTDRLIYGCSGFPSYMRDQIEVPGARADIKYLVALADGHLAGFAEILCRPPHLFLNYICADKERNIKGLGSSLLKQSLRMLGAEDYRSMILDVFADNALAVRWYDKLGFIETGRNRWWDIPLEEGNGQGYLSQFPQARLCQERFGFARFQVLTAKQVYEVGMLGKNWFRITRPEILQDHDALAVLASVDANRRLLAILPEYFSPRDHGVDASELATSLRMEGNCPDIMRNLDGK